jgi:hypothetical protein
MRHKNENWFCKSYSMNPPFNPDNGKKDWVIEHDNGVKGVEK